jgi:tRNA-uridine 2-sulfurtransferase
MARVLVAMSGGVDSSVAAALLRDRGHDVVGATMKLWGGPSDSGCCSVADVDDARSVARRLGIDHHVFNFTDDFDRDVVAPYVEAHSAGRTPNPCIECNRHLKFDRFLRRARQLGFDAIATGHHARVVPTAAGPELRRGADRAKDQSYVLHMLGPDQLARLLLPVGELTKAEVRQTATELGLATAAKPDSQDVCFISGNGGRRRFLADRLPLTPGRLVDEQGSDLGPVDAVELVTVGQRRGLGALGPEPAYAVAVDVQRAEVRIGRAAALLTDRVEVAGWTWTGAHLDDGSLEVQTSAHGEAVPGRLEGTVVVLDKQVRRVAPGQSVVLYRGDTVIGGGLAA